MNMKPRELSTVELISQQALEISRLNYANIRLLDDQASTWHPEFGTVWRYIGMISDLIKLVTKIGNRYMLKCDHKDRYEHEDCLFCETARLINDAKICIDNITVSKVKRINENATSNTNS